MPVPVAIMLVVVIMSMEEQKKKNRNKNLLPEQFKWNIIKANQGVSHSDWIDAVDQCGIYMRILK